MVSKSKPLNILHAAETIKGGVATVMGLLLTSQMPRHAVRTIIPNAHASELPASTQSTHIPFHHTGRNLASLWNLTKTLYTQLHTNPPQILHLHSTFAGVIGRILVLTLPQAKRPKVVYCPHAFAFLMATSPLKRAIYTWVERFLAPLTHTIICVSAFERQQAIQSGLPADKLKLIYNGVPQPKTAPKSKKPSNPLQLLFVGRFDAQKGFDILHQAMQTLPQEHFHLTAVGAPVHADAPHPAPLPNITYTGWVKPDQIGTYYNQADLVIVPSRWEGFAMVPLEALSRAKPLIVSTAASLPEVIDDSCCGLAFETGEPAALTETLRIINPKFLPEMGQSGYQRFLKHFTSQSMCQSTEEVYTS